MEHLVSKDDYRVRFWYNNKPLKLGNNLQLSLSDFKKHLEKNTNRDFKYACGAPQFSNYILKKKIFFVFYTILICSLILTLINLILFYRKKTKGYIPTKRLENSGSESNIMMDIFPINM